MAPPDAQDLTEFAKEMKKDPADYHLSKRAMDNALYRDHWGAFEKVLGNPWHKTDHPNGTINIGVAENSLMHGEISAYFEQAFKIAPAMHLTYGVGPRGSLRLRKALCGLFNSRFGARKEATPQELLIVSGVASAIDLLTWAVCDEGEGILLPQPYYQGFPAEIGDRSNGRIVPVPFLGVDGFRGVDDYFNPRVNEAALERAYQRALDAGITPKAYILVNPHNPLGKCYSLEVIRSILRFCGRHQLHVISDEIYAMSVFGNPTDSKAEPFRSVLSLDVDDLIDPRLVHVIYGASKDYGLNGARLGVLQSRNEALVQAVSTVSMFSWVPYMIQETWARMLEDEAFLSRFIDTNHRKLRHNFGLMTRFLEKHKIPYIQGSNAGVFLWADLRRLLLDDPSAYDPASSKLINVLTEKSPNIKKYRIREDQILNICWEHGVFLGAGSKFCTEELGWFRITFTVEEEMLQEAMRRIEKGLAEYERVKHADLRARL